MSQAFPNFDFDLEEGQVSERSSDAGRSSPTSNASNGLHQSSGFLGLEFIRYLGHSSPHLVNRAHSVGQDTSQPETPKNSTTRSQGANYSPGELFADPWRHMWIKSLPQFREYDKEITDRWKSDADGVLVFTGLFSATVAAFIIESYKKLSVDSGDQTVTLLSQVSQQLVGISNGTVLSTSPPLSNSPPNLHSAIRVNILFLLSLGISITCALLATLVKQWARRYMALSYLHDIPHERARVRTFLFTGMERFRMRQTVEAIPVLLHISVFLFFAGLVNFFFLFNKTVAWVFVGWIGVFASVYAAFTVIPNIILSCPYGTPFTGLLWRLWRVLAIIKLASTGAAATTLDGFLQRSWGIWGRIYKGTSASIAPLLDREKLAKKIATHKHWFSKGLNQRVVSDASKASSSVDREALIWTLSRLDEDKEVEDYLSRIPGFFNSRVVPGAMQTMLRVMDSPSIGGDSVLAVRLGGLLKSCLPTSTGVDLDTDQNRLDICLTAIWCYTKAYNLTNSRGVPMSMSKSFRGLFADENEIYPLLENDDLHTRVVVLCMGSLLVAKLMGEMRGQEGSPQVSEGELVFIKRALGPLWRLDLAGRMPTQLTNLGSMLSELEEIVEKRMDLYERLGYKVLDTMDVLAKDAIDTIPPPPSTENQGPDLSVLKRTRGLLERCLALSEQCGADINLGGLKRNDAFNSLVKMREGLQLQVDTRLAELPPHPGSPAHVHDLDKEAQSTSHEGASDIPHDTVSSAIRGAPTIGKEALTLTVAELRDDDEFEAFIARIPTLFSSYHVSDTSVGNILDLMAPPSEGGSTLASSLHDFFEACLPGKSTLDPDVNPDVRKRRLPVCLAAIWSYAMAYCKSDSRKRPIPEQFPRLFADSDDMDLLTEKGDTNTRVMVLCITSLLVTKIVRDIRHRSGNSPEPEGESAFLQNTLGSFQRPDLPPVSPGPTKLAALLVMLDGLDKLVHQETSPLKTLGREASETLDILVRVVQDSLPEDLPLEPWGSSASAIERSREALKRCLSLLEQMSEGEDGLVKSAWADTLIKRLSDLEAKLASYRPEPAPTIEPPTEQSYWPFRPRRQQPNAV
ncbi:hypothetical protein H4582DRAFT_1882714 [Lactarius indigo]|nr:hypothetical protein H4582DRAFT_1882714 [Lactarius indigo]